jgi:hypothetical protein
MEDKITLHISWLEGTLKCSRGFFEKRETNTGQLWLDADLVGFHGTQVVLANKLNNRSDKSPWHCPDTMADFDSD